MLFGVIIAFIGFILCAYGIWHLDKPRGFPILFLSLIPLTIGIGMCENAQAHEFRKECLYKNGVVAYTQSSRELICIPQRGY